MMKKSRPAASPDAYVAALRGWRRACVETLRKSVLAAAPLEEVIKWRNILYLSNGPVLMIRAEPSRVLFGFWRGQRLLDIEPGLKPGGKYEMATLELREGAKLSPARIKKLTAAAVGLNARLGNPAVAVTKKS